MSESELLELWRVEEVGSDAVRPTCIAKVETVRAGHDLAEEAGSGEYHLTTHDGQEVDSWVMEDLDPEEVKADFVWMVERFPSLFERAAAVDVLRGK